MFWTFYSKYTVYLELLLGIYFFSVLIDYIYIQMLCVTEIMDLKTTSVPINRLKIKTSYNSYLQTSPMIWPDSICIYRTISFSLFPSKLI